ncbi:hypothetical protein [Sphingopyxis sp. PET50]|uniref:hypothetical protein n=1 Tax=Sphingopyxis sp. PET50 TaxID=2976533 RepID=UPI0021B00FBE|nr:hypothetical protein [Sphingopyxis sp. PET50]
MKTMRRKFYQYRNRWIIWKHYHLRPSEECNVYEVMMLILALSPFIVGALIGAAVINASQP